MKVLVSEEEAEGERSKRESDIMAGRKEEDGAMGGGDLEWRGE